MARSTCRDCNRHVAVAVVEGRRVILDPEPIRVIRMERGFSGEPELARRLHAERCTDYQEQDRKNRLRAEMREYTQRHGSRSGRRTGM